MCATIMLRTANFAFMSIHPSLCLPRSFLYTHLAVSAAAAPVEAAVAMSSALSRSTSTAPSPTSLPPMANGGGSAGGAAGGIREGGVVSGVLGARHLLRDGPPSSPLQIFVRAKKKINDIYQEVEEYVGEARLFLEGVCAGVGEGTGGMGNTSLHSCLMQ